MRFTCQPVDNRFFDDAPWIYRNEVDLDWSVERVFADWEDAESWPQWFGGVKKIEWTSQKPFGVGTTRTVTLESMKVFEHFFNWEPNKRLSFYFLGTSAPAFRRFAEDYQLEPRGSGCHFKYTVAIDPNLLLRVGAPIARGQFDAMFKQAALGFQRRCQTQK